MAAIAAPILEAVGARVLAALGIGIVGGGLAGEVDSLLRKRQEEAEKAKAAPLARAQTQATTKEKCKECPPDRGALVPVNYSMSENSSRYQARITGFAPGTEWRFGGRDFDGFKSGLCLLQEAKADYDQFLDTNGQPRYIFQREIFIKMAEQAVAQATIVRSNKPASLAWYFQTPLSYARMKTQLAVLGITPTYAP